MRHTFLLATLCAALVLGLTPRQAQACGGFFCNFQNPVVQAAERVLYVQEGAKITVHIQIAYQGPSTKFSWVLPLAKQPTLGIGSDSIFSALENATSPQFYLQTNNSENCYFNQCMYPMASAGEGDGTTQTKGSNGVTILAQEAVGPYDTVVLQGDSGAAVQKWLSDNGYDQPPATAGLLDVYAKKQFVFLALKLQKDKTDGDLQPIVLTLQETGPCLPIRLTALAANPDMPIIIWSLAQHRAIPKNYLHVELNPKTIDWFSGGGNYYTVASQAVDQASGHAFLTEYAGPSSLLKGQLAYATWDTGKLADIPEPGKFLQEMLNQGLPRTSQMQALIRKFIPKPAEFQAETDQTFYGCVQSQCAGSCGDPCTAIQAAVAKQTFDAKGFAKALQAGVVAPLQAVQTSFDNIPYLTRLFTLVSPEEMGKDPIFGVNPDLPDVPRQHTAQATPICEAGSKLATQAKLVFEDGSTLTLPVPKADSPGVCNGYGYYGANTSGRKGPIVAAGGQPAKQVEVLDESGAPIIIDPMEADKVDAELNNAQLGTPSLTADFVKSLPKITWNPDKIGGAPAVAANKNGTAISGGCSTNGRSSGGTGAWLGLGALALGVLVLRRRRA